MAAQKNEVSLQAGYLRVKLLYPFDNLQVYLLVWPPRPSFQGIPLKPGKLCLISLQVVHRSSAAVKLLNAHEFMATIFGQPRFSSVVEYYR